jgi:hypothetical protein
VVFFSLVAFGALLATIAGRAWGHDPLVILGTYRVLFYNAAVLAVGLVMVHSLREVKRGIFLILNLCMLLVFILIQLS